MSDISKAIKAKQTEIKNLQADIEALQQAASIIGGNAPAGKPKRKRSKMSAAAKKAVSKRMRAYWAKKRKGQK